MAPSPLPYLTIRYYENSYAHNYDIENSLRFVLFIYGNANGNGFINVAEVTVFRRYIMASGKEAFIKDNANFIYINADVNGYGGISEADVMLLMQYLWASN